MLNLNSPLLSQLGWHLDNCSPALLESKAALGITPRKGNNQGSLLALGDSVYSVNSLVPSMLPLWLGTPCEKGLGFHSSHFVHGHIMPPLTEAADAHNVTSPVVSSSQKGWAPLC